MDEHESGVVMLDLSAWFSPTFLDLIWYNLFGHFIGYTKEQTKAWFARQNAERQNSVDDFNEILYKEDDEFK